MMMNLNECVLNKKEIIHLNVLNVALVLMVIGANEPINHFHINDLITTKPLMYPLTDANFQSPSIVLLFMVADFLLRTSDLGLSIICTCV